MRIQGLHSSQDVGWFATSGLTPTSARRPAAEVLKSNAAMLLDSGFYMNEVTRCVATPGGPRRDIATGFDEVLTLWARPSD